MQRRSILICARVLVFVLLASLASHGQDGFDVNKLNLPKELSGFTGPGPQSHGIKVTSRLMVDRQSKTGLLTIELHMEENWKIYSLTQKAGGPTPTKIYLDPSDVYRLAGTFASNRPPKVEYSEDFRMNVESFGKSVTWSVPIELEKDVPLGSVVVSGYVEGLACAGQCVRFGKASTRFESQAIDGPAGLMKSWALGGTHTKVRAWFVNAKVRPGGMTQLMVAFQPEPNWHVYAYSPRPIPFQTPALVQLGLPAGWQQGPVRSAAPVISKVVVQGEAPVREYLGPATLAIPVKIPANAQLGANTVTANIGLQTCSDRCDSPVAFAVSGLVTVDTVAGNEPGFVQLSPNQFAYSEVVRAVRAVETAKPENGQQPPVRGSRVENAESPILVEPQKNSLGPPLPPSNVDLTQLEFSASQQQSTLGNALLMALLGGFVLNFMPCVLPVIGLKIVSFVDQAGSERSKVFALNAAYVFGILAVFWVLAGLSLAGIGWGNQFNNRTFLISLISLVFVMALSFFGIWEIPIPGFATSQKATKLTENEGYLGAFFKGMITTLLATPCGAPFFGVAYGFAVQSRDPLTAFLIFSCVGLGMGLPYLLIGAFPSTIRWLPRPGAWMETFKQFMGFILLGTVVYLMQSLPFKDILPVVGFLFGLWFACWWIGRIPMTAPSEVRFRGWGMALIISCAALAFAFSSHGLVGHADQKYTRVITKELLDANDSAGTVVLTDSDPDHLPWEPFNTAKMNQMLSQGETVLVDFTADWCPNCRALEAAVLNTEPIKEIVSRNGIRTIVADLGTQDPDMVDLLVKLQGHSSIPFLAIFPSGEPNKVLRFPGMYSSDKLAKALAVAGPSGPSRVKLAHLPSSVAPPARVQRRRQQPSSSRTIQRSPSQPRRTPQQRKYQQLP